jgi:iron(III) transport system permease protein
MFTRRDSITIYGTLLLALGGGLVLTVFWGDPRTVSLASTTLRLASAVGLRALPWGTLLAVLLWRTDLPGRGFLLAALAWLMFVPLYVQATAWRAGFGLFGLFASPDSFGSLWLEGFSGAVWIHTIHSLPWVVMIAGAGLSLVEAELEDEGLIEARAMGVLWHITLRRAAASIVAAGLWVVVVTSAEMTITDLFRVRTYAEELYTQLNVGLEPGATALRGLPAVVMALWLVLAAVVLCAQLAPAARSGGLERRRSFSLGPWRWPALGFVWLSVGVTILVPLISLGYQAGVAVESTPSGFQRHWSAWKLVWLTAQTPGRIWPELYHTLQSTTLAALLTVAVAIPLAWIARRGRWPAYGSLFVVAVTLAVPGPIIGFFLIWLMNRPMLGWFYDRTMLPLCLAMFLRALPLATMICWYALRSVPGESIESARVDGAGSSRVLWQIAVPQRWAAIGIAWIVAVAISLGDLTATSLVQQTGRMTLAFHIFNQLHSGGQDLVAADCLTALGILTLLAIGLWWLIAHWRRANANPA